MLIYASRSGFASGVMSLTETGKGEFFPIGDLVLLYIILKEELCFQFGD